MKDASFSISNVAFEVENEAFDMKNEAFETSNVAFAMGNEAFLAGTGHLRSSWRTLCTVSLKFSQGVLLRFSLCEMASAARTELAFFRAAEVSFLFHAIQYKKMLEQKGQPFVRPVTDEAVLKAAKEIMVKFIEIGKVTPTNFEEHYRLVFNTIKKSAKELSDDSAA